MLAGKINPILYDILYSSFSKHLYTVYGHTVKAFAEVVVNWIELSKPHLNDQTNVCVCLHIISFELKKYDMLATTERDSERPEGWGRR